MRHAVGWLAGALLAGSVGCAAHPPNFRAEKICISIIADVGGVPAMAPEVDSGQLLVTTATSMLNQAVAKLSADISDARADHLDDVAGAALSLRAAVETYARDFPMQDASVELVDIGRIGHAINTVGGLCHADVRPG